MPSTKNDPVSNGTPSVKVGDSLNVMSAERDGDLPPASPFGELPKLSESEHSAAGRDERLDGAGLPEHLLSGLSSLSNKEFKLYMQLTEELVKGREPEGEPKNTRPLEEREDLSSTASIENDEQLQEAVKRLESLLPETALSQLKSYTSYGLLDVLHARSSGSEAPGPEIPESQQASTET